MYYPEKLKINKLVHARIPKKCEYFKRFGEVPSNDYYGEEAPYEQKPRTIENLYELEQLAKEDK